MANNLYSEAHKGVMEIINQVGGSIAKDFQKIEPYRKEPTQQDIVEHYIRLSTEEKDLLYWKHGQVWVDFAIEMDNLIQSGGVAQW